MSNPMKPMRAVRGICQSVCVISLLLTCGVLSAQRPERGVKNIVLVPNESLDLIMDFTDPIIRGVSVFHCHLLSHEDKGMMAKILFE